MPKLSCLIGVLLIITGVAAYYITGQKSLTAMIPAIPGLLLFILGLLAHKEGLRKHMMHVAVMISLLFLVAGLIKGLPALTKGKTDVAVDCLIMAGLCLIHLVAGVRSFINARRARKA